MKRTTSPEGIEFLMEEEGFEAIPYLDIAGILTVGCGHVVLPGEDFGGGITEEDGMELLRKDLAWAEKAVNDLVLPPLSANEFDALVSLVFNIGRTNFQSSTLLRLLNVGEFDLAAKQFTRWNKARIKGVLKEINGLTNRRIREAKMFLGEVAR